MLTNDRNTVLYTGSTTDLKGRLVIHRNRSLKGFTERYNAHRLVYYERYSSKEIAAAREMAINGMTRDKKGRLIARINVRWRDLWPDLQKESL